MKAKESFVDSLQSIACLTFAKSTEPLSSDVFRPSSLYKAEPMSIASQFVTRGKKVRYAHSPPLLTR